MAEQPIQKSSDFQAVMTYFAPTVVPVFKARYVMANEAEVLELFDGMEAAGMESGQSNLACWHTGYDSLERWPDLFEDFASDMARACFDALVPGKAADSDFDIERVDMELWYAHYRAGDYAQPHNHGFDSISFCYYAEAGEGAANFIVHQMGLDVGAPVEHSRVVIPVTTGDLLMFPGFLQHSVPKTSVERRVFAGNIRAVGLGFQPA